MALSRRDGRRKEFHRPHALGKHIPQVGSSEGTNFGARAIQTPSFVLPAVVNRVQGTWRGFNFNAAELMQ
jgi:hypothetical protein